MATSCEIIKFLFSLANNSVGIINLVYSCVWNIANHWLLIEIKWFILTTASYTIYIK